MNRKPPKRLDAVEVLGVHPAVRCFLGGWLALETGECELFLRSRTER